MVASLAYSLIRLLLEVMLTNRRDEAQLQAEVLALRRQVQVLERQIKRVRVERALDDSVLGYAS